MGLASVLAALVTLHVGFHLGFQKASLGAKVQQEPQGLNAASSALPLGIFDLVYLDLSYNSETRLTKFMTLGLHPRQREGQGLDLPPRCGLLFQEHTRRS